MTKYFNKDITKENTRKIHETNNKMPLFTQEWKRNVIKGMHVKTPARPSTRKEMECAVGIIKVKIFF